MRNRPANLSDLYSEELAHQHVPTHRVEVPGVTLTVHAHCVITSGEDLLIRIEHAVDREGFDITEKVAHAIASAINEGSL